MIKFTPVAEQDLVRLVDFLLPKIPVGAFDVADRLEAAINGLAEMPYMGRPGADENTRELVVMPYIVVYRVLHTDIEILHLYHSAENWKK
jgi:plasmid stabilization system protein ParE